MPERELQSAVPAWAHAHVFGGEGERGTATVHSMMGSGVPLPSPIRPMASVDESSLGGMSRGRPSSAGARTGRQQRPPSAQQRPASASVHGRHSLGRPSLLASRHSVLDEADGQLWWAGKQMLRQGQVLSDYIGKNEKTKLIVKLQKAGGGQPTREAAVDEETQKKMMAYYHKKQEAMKALEEDDDDDYANSSWANPKALKSSLNGVGDVRMR